MPPFFRSNLSGVIRFHERVAHNALTAAAIVVRNQAKRNVRGGFKSGDFVTGNLMNKIEYRVSVAEKTAEIGTEVDYGAYWELGHHNTFTGKYERHEWLRPALEKTVAEQQTKAGSAARKAGARILSRGNF